MNTHEEEGMVLFSAVAFLGILALAATTAFLMITTDLKIGRNHKLGEQVYYSALAGGEEARARLRDGAGHPIKDMDRKDGGWRSYIGTPEELSGKGYDSGNTLHARYDRLTDALNYTVVIQHQIDPSGSVVFWGDSDGDGTWERNTVSGENIYLVASSHYAGGLHKIIQTEVARVPPLTVPAALYVDGSAVVQGNDTWVSGEDPCGTGDVPGVLTTQSAGAVTLVGTAEVIGAGGTVPNVQYGAKEMDIQRMVDSLKKTADFPYVVSAADQGPADTPGPGDGWGAPTAGAGPKDPSSCPDKHTMYYATGGTYVRFAGGVTGCGVLLVEGDLEVEGDFRWHGPIVVTGSVVFTGGGDKQITGAMIVGESALIGGATGNTGIVYCSTAIESQTQNRPLCVLSWKEVM